MEAVGLFAQGRHYFQLLLECLPVPPSEVRKLLSRLLQLGSGPGVLPLNAPPWCLKVKLAQSILLLPNFVMEQQCLQRSYFLFFLFWWKCGHVKCSCTSEFMELQGKEPGIGSSWKGKWVQGRRTGNFPFCFHFLNYLKILSHHILAKVHKDQTLAGSHSWCDKDSHTEGCVYKLSRQQEKPSSSPPPA